MKTITFTSLKGGVGKSSTTILTANYLGASGYRVLVIDIDLANSSSQYYLNDDTKNLINEKNITSALVDNKKLTECIVLTNKRGVDLVPSGFYLADLPHIDEKEMLQLVSTVKDEYDFVLIDTSSGLSSLNISAYNAADYIITPVNLSLFDHNTAQTIEKKIQIKTNKFNNWYIHINGFNSRFMTSSGGEQKDYLDIFKTEYRNLTPVSSWFPHTSAVRKVIDRDMFLSRQKKAGCIKHIPLFNAIRSLSNFFMNNNETIIDLEEF